jgi:hypothetical protein
MLPLLESHVACRASKPTAEADTGQPTRRSVKSTNRLHVKIGRPRRRTTIGSISSPAASSCAASGPRQELRITLSYFIEPNPSERGWASRYRYESHGLRLAVKNPLESETNFRHRVNAYARAEEAGERVSVGDERWLLGPQLRHRGSLHSDRWSGPANELADRGAIAIYPTLGWWRELKRQERFERVARYSVLLSITSPETAVDLYEPVETAIRAKVAAVI